MTGHDIVRRALMVLGVLGAGETMDPDDAADGLETLNDLVDSLRLDSLWAAARTRVSHTLVASTPSYTIGTGGDINVERPDWIEAAAVILDTSVAGEMEVPIEVFTPQRWQGVMQKDLESGVVTGVHYARDYTAGLGTIEPWPVPSVGTLALILYVPGLPITSFADGTTEYTFAPGYKRALRYNLALELAPEFGKGASADMGAIQRIAMDSLTAVKRRNQRPVELVADTGLMRVGGYGGAFNPYTGSGR